jgi:DNA-binding CsgD family transcriptional regulator
MEPRRKDPEEPRPDDESSPRVVSLQVGEAQFAVLSVPLADSSTLLELTPVERQVAQLAAAGLSNAAIGRCRGTAERTVANQMASILRKLRVSSRYELAARLALSSLGKEEP